METVAPGLISYARHSPAPVINELLALCRRNTRPSEALGSIRGPAGQLCNRSVRSIQAAVAVADSPSAHIGGGGRIPPSPRTCLGIPIASRQEQHHEATIPTRAREAEVLIQQTSRRPSSQGLPASVTFESRVGTIGLAIHKRRPNDRGGQQWCRAGVDGNYTHIAASCMSV